MKHYISDIHFGHTNVIKYDKRPFTNREEMDRVSIERWNEKVQAQDEVYIVGDFCYKSDKSPDWYLKQLNGHKFLIVGNHDKITVECKAANKYLEGVDKMLHVSDNGRQICLCHYPMIEWYNSRHGSYLIYGHIHNKRDEVWELMKLIPNCYNAAVCINDYVPVTFEELLINNIVFNSLDGGICYE